MKPIHEIKAEMMDTLALINAATIKKSKKMLGQIESVLGADSTIQSLCEDIVSHYENYRANLLTGKALTVAYSGEQCEVAERTRIAEKKVSEAPWVRPGPVVLGDLCENRKAVGTTAG